VALFLQFTRVINIFWLINGILQCFPAIKNNSPLVTFVPLALVLVVGMLREGLADLKRWQEDRHTNARLYMSINSNKAMKEMRQVRSEELCVGDLIQIHDG
jgi:hypothetical protein